ncbi:hypothetical protein F2P81_020898 [Scophthalmus maximus]|uniref:Uncharacterized protein n=1 Tax=Scophthalmus maximus TaxID=52904 RepID=A0A6A4S4U4_SCOMX|nr:hypothetical protein F2P81_020898 [Scophthalmus maximus]
MQGTATSRAQRHWTPLCQRSTCSGTDQNLSTCSATGGEERVLAYGSRQLSATEQNYCTTRRELLAAVEFTSHLRQYLLGRPFIICTDHSGLRWLTKLREPDGQLARWLEKVAEYDFQVIRRQGNTTKTLMRFQGDPAERHADVQCQSLTPPTSIMMHKAVQCNLASNLPEANPTEQPPVRVVEPDGCQREYSAAEIEFAPVGVEDGPYGSSDCAAFHPNYCRVSEPHQANLFGGWTQEQLSNAQETDMDIAPVRRWMDGERGRPPWADIAACSPATEAYWAQWERLKNNKRVKNKVRKFLPSYEGPYFVVGMLDDLVYRIKNGPRTKTTVAHHDKLKPYCSRTPLDNSWVFQDAETWTTT